MGKGPKTMNPADKARREARRKELKKNKKQRQQVRSAAIERKDPEQIIADLEQLDKCEFDLASSPAMSDSFYKDKRKRLKETWTKILAYYLKEDPERHAKLKKLESEYELKFKKLSKDFIAIKAAQEVKIEDIFLPPEPNNLNEDVADEGPLMSESVYITLSSEGMKPPGCPPGCPPNLKQLVDNLQNSLIAHSSLVPKSLPLDLVGLQSNQNNKMLQPGARLQSQTFRIRTRNMMEYPAQPKQRINNSGISELKETKSEDKNDKLVTGKIQSTVIESKPVIFKPKASKFVPSSVRAKIMKNAVK